MSSIYFNVKSAVHEDKKKLLEIFFKDWVDRICDNDVEYNVEPVLGQTFYTSVNKSAKWYRVDFKKQEDATALLLRGVPAEFQNYLEIVDHSGQ